MVNIPFRPLFIFAQGLPLFLAEQENAYKEKSAFIDYF